MKKKESRVSEQKSEYQISAREKQIVKKYFPILLKEDIEFREEVMSHLTGVLATKEDIAKILAEIAELRAENLRVNTRIEKIEENIGKMFAQIDEHTRILAENTKILYDHTRSIESFNYRLDALGARWGVLAEEAFRSGVRGMIADLGYFVDKWRVNDKDGIVLGRPSMVEADILIKDNVHLLIEIKSSVSKYDISGFKKISELYEKLNNVKPKLMVISPSISSDAQTLAKELEVEIYSHPEEAFERKNV